MSHLRHTTSLCIAHIGKVNKNQRVICLILIYNVPRSGQASLLQKQMLPRITCPQMAASEPHTHDSQSDLEHQHSLFLGAAGHQSQLGSLFKGKSAACNLAVGNCFFSIKMQGWIIQLSWTNFSDPNIFWKTKWSKGERDKGRRTKQTFVFSS